MARPDHAILLRSFEELQRYLLDWRSFGDGAVYDAAGMMALLDACVANLRGHAHEVEIAEYSDSLSGEERAFFARLASGREAPPLCD